MSDDAGGFTVMGGVARYPARTLALWFFGLIFFGAVLLYIPPLSQNPGNPPLSFVDCLFTATSAACVTGLTVGSTPDLFSVYGQVVILLLIQLGGIGILTLTTMIVSMFGRRDNLRQRWTMAETLGSRVTDDARNLVARVVLVTLVIELLGAASLLVTYRGRGMVWPDAIWTALFHSVSAFCNAGFALHKDNLMPDVGDVNVNLTICSLIIVGGLGFPVLFDLARMVRRPRGQRWHRLSLHTKFMLLGTVVFIVGGAVLFWVFERHNALRSSSGVEQILASYFQSVTTRTAGFNTVDMAALTSATLWIMMIGMFVGAGPCSTAGGAKISTVMVLVVFAYSRLVGRQRASAYRRTVSSETVGRAMGAILTYGLLAAAGVTLLLAVEPAGAFSSKFGGAFLDRAFEVVSALGTVGLSTGLTPTLSTAGKLVIIALMFVGRVGPFTLFVVLARPPADDPIVYPKEDVILG
ncbi:MAG: TrkH family potassium uptake protein [Planctomycetia bacterium]